MNTIRLLARRHDARAEQICDELIDNARLAGDEESARLASAVRRAVRQGDEEEIERLKVALEARARQLEDGDLEFPNQGMKGRERKRRM